MIETPRIPPNVIAPETSPVCPNEKLDYTPPRLTKSHDSTLLSRHPCFCKEPMVYSFTKQQATASAHAQIYGCCHKKNRAALALDIISSPLKTPQTMPPTKKEDSQLPSNVNDCYRESRRRGNATDSSRRRAVRGLAEKQRCVLSGSRLLNKKLKKSWRLNSSEDPALAVLKQRRRLEHPVKLDVVQKSVPVPVQVPKQHS